MLSAYCIACANCWRVFLETTHLSLTFNCRSNNKTRVFFIFIRLLLFIKYAYHIKSRETARLFNALHIKYRETVHKFGQVPNGLHSKHIIEPSWLKWSVQVQPGCDSATLGCLFFMSLTVSFRRLHSNSRSAMPIFVGLVAPSCAR
jgi:hypothetical protein